MKLLILLLAIILFVKSQEGSGIQPTEKNQTCSDVLPNCSRYVNSLCKQPKYKYLMAEKCASTCSLCCKDNQKSCMKWSLSGFCSSKNYSDEVKAKHCALTCDLCPKSTTNTTL